MQSHDRYAHRILAEIEGGQPISQRSLARRLGIALGLTNLLLRRLARKGWIRVTGLRPHRVSYVITPAGIAEKARMTREYLQQLVTVYSEARDRISERFASLSSALGEPNGSGPQRLVFYGAGELAEIGYVCLQGTGFRLVGVIDGQRSRPFFGFDVQPPDALQPDSLAGVPFDVLVVMSVEERGDVQKRLDALEFPSSRVFWV